MTRRRCEFENVAAGLVCCVRCGRELRTTQDPSRVHAACKGPRGLGDVIATVAHKTGIARAVKTVAGWFGVEDCGCQGRRDRVNRAVPFRRKSG